MEKNRIIVALAFTFIASNTAFAESPMPADFFGPFLLKEAPPEFCVDSLAKEHSSRYIGATGEDCVVAEFSPEGTIIIRGRGKMMDFEIFNPLSAICKEKNNLIKVVVESGVTHIGDWTFYGCENLETIIVASDNKAYSSKDGVLYDKNFSTLILIPEGKSGILTIPEGVTSIRNSAFYNSSITSITIPSSLTSMREDEFHSCESLETIIVASGNKVYSSKDGVLYDKNFSTLIRYPGGKSGIATIPEGVTSIGYQAFSKSNLSSVIIPNSVTSIGKYAFLNSSLSSITIPNSVTSIGSHVFYNCEKLPSITILNPAPPLLRDYYNYQGQTILYVPKGSVDAYRQADGWKYFKNIEPIE